MIQLQLSAHNTDPTALSTTTLYKNIVRDWPSVPSKGDLISIGGGDSVIESVVGVEWLDGKIVLHLVTRYPSETLLDLGFDLP